MSSKPDYERASNALAFYAQNKLGMKLHSSDARSAFERGYRFNLALELRGAPLWSGEYFMGAGHRQEDGSAPIPQIADVLHSIFLDASCWENASDLLEFASEYGYAIDTHEERMQCKTAFEACARTAHKLRDGLTDEEHATLSQLSSMI